MARCNFDTRPISRLMSYTIEEICQMFKKYDLKPQTVRGWINKDGLPVCWPGSPMLIHGEDLVKFLKEYKVRNKVNMDFDEIYCVHCRKRHSLAGANITADFETHAIRVRCLCPNSGRLVSRLYKLSEYDQLCKVFHVSGNPILNDSEIPNGGNTTTINSNNDENKGEKDA